MTETDPEHYRQRLLARRSELQALEQASRDGSATVELDQSKVGRLSRMDAMQSQQMALETARRREQELARIAGALRRLESGDFGYCFVCDEPIDPRRLDADPTSTRCADCAD